MMKIEATHELFAKIVEKQPDNAVARFALHLFELDHPRAGWAVLEAEERRMEAYVEKAWDLLTDQQKLTLSKQVLEAVIGELRKPGGASPVKRSLETFVSRMIEAQVESLTPEILSAVQKKINEQWDTSVDRVVHVALERAVAKVKAEIIK